MDHRAGSMNSSTADLREFYLLVISRPALLSRVHIARSHLISSHLN